MSNNRKVTSRTAIGERIRKLRHENKYSQVFVAEDLCISQAAYSLIENSQNGIVAEHVIRLSGLYGVTTDYILKGNKMLLEVSPENGFLPFIKIDAQASFVKNIDNPTQLEVQDYYRIPGNNFSSNRQKLFEVDGDSMIPTIFPRDVVICQVQENLDNLLEGTLILLITGESVLIKRFDNFDKDGNLIISDDNPDKQQQVFTVKREQVKQVMVVSGKTTTTLVPHHHIVSQGKIKMMEDSIEFLKKELQKLNQKLSKLES